MLELEVAGTLAGFHKGRLSLVKVGRVGVPWRDLYSSQAEDIKSVIPKTLSEGHCVVLGTEEEGTNSDPWNWCDCTSFGKYFTKASFRISLMNGASLC